MDYQINYGTVAATPAVPRADSNAPLFASEDGLVASLAGNECIFQVKRTGESHVMTFQVLQALDQCREFRTLDEHIARIVSTVPGLSGQTDNVHRVLNGLIQRRLLTSDESFISELTRADALRVEPLRAVFIRACDRPEQLSRLLATLAEDERRHRGGRHFVLLDDSTSAAHADRNRDLVREFARTTGCKVSYLGRNERARLVERLGKAVPAARPSLDWLLERSARTRRPGGGRSWNLALLLSAGSRLLLLDEDFRMPLRTLDARRSGLAPNPGSQAIVRFYRNMEEALAAGEEVPGDAIAKHLEMCGQTLGTLLSTCPELGIDRASLRGLNLGRLGHMRSAARIISTVNGTYGSSGTESGLWMYQLDAASRAEFWRDRESYLRNIEANHIWYGYEQAKAASFSYFTPFVLDNSQLLPCTNPDGRGEDGLHSVASHFCHPDSLALQLPTAIGHVQEGERSRAARALAAHTPRVNHFVRDYVIRQLGVFKAEQPAQRLRLLGELLDDLAGASVESRAAALAEYLGYVRSEVIERSQQQLEAAADAPLHWQADVRAIVQANGKALLSGAPPRLGDWSDELDSKGCAEALRAELSDLAGAWRVWPQVWDHAREQGDRLLSAL